MYCNRVIQKQTYWFFFVIKFLRVNVLFNFGGCHVKMEATGVPLKTTRFCDEFLANVRPQSPGLWQGTAALPHLAVSKRLSAH